MVPSPGCGYVVPLYLSSSRHLYLSLHPYRCHPFAFDGLVDYSFHSHSLADCVSAPLPWPPCLLAPFPLPSSSSLCTRVAAAQILHGSMVVPIPPLHPLLQPHCPQLVQVEVVVVVVAVEAKEVVVVALRLFVEVVEEVEVQIQPHSLQEQQVQQVQLSSSMRPPVLKL